VLSALGLLDLRLPTLNSRAVDALLALSSSPG
jgi:hypothetical protein